MEWENLYGRPGEAGSPSAGTLEGSLGPGSESGNEPYTPGLNPLTEAMKQAELLIAAILNESTELMTKKETIAIGAGLTAAGLTRYFLMHPELVKTALEQIGDSLELQSLLGGSGGGAGGMAATLASAATKVV